MMISDRRLVINAELNELRKAHTESLNSPTFVDTWGTGDYVAYWERRKRIGLLRDELAKLDAVSD
jgi:hypothetical protein